MISIDEQNGEYCVYAHINKINGKVYIGITSIQPRARWANGNGYKKNPHFFNSINKYGWDNFEHIILEEGLSSEMALIMEGSLIEKYDTTNPKCGYNIMTGGTVSKHSKESIEKLRKLHLGKKMSEETKEKIRAKTSGENGYWYGKIRPLETRIKISKAKFGKKVPDEVKKKISNTLKGDGSYWYGKHLSDEHKQKLREKNLGKTIPQDVREKISKAGMNRNGVEISQYTLEGVYIRNFPSAAEASRNTGADTSEIIKCCKNKKGYVCGYQWRYASDGIDMLADIRKKKILQYDTNEQLIREWDTQVEAANAVGTTKNAINACLRGKSKTCKGYIWKYSD